MSRDIAASLGIFSTSILSILHKHLAVKKINNCLKNDWCKEILENSIEVFQKTFKGSSQVTNHGSMYDHEPE